MPELPDVEVFKRYFEDHALHKTIDHVEIRSDTIVKKVSSRSLRQTLANQSFDQARRIGKYLLVRLSGGASLVVHFGMTGSFAYAENGDGEQAYARALFDFKGGGRLAFVNKRQFGFLSLTPDQTRFIDEHALGPDALSLSRDEFTGRLEGRRGTIKAVLMNQSVMAGIGNIYSDEILFQTGIRPDRGVASLSAKERASLHRTMRRVLETAIRHNADPHAFPASYLTPRREADAPCPRGTGSIKKATISGRSAYFCPSCQH
jgi:formamidopyrimidine-DNA glycosylase